MEKDAKIVNKIIVQLYLHSLKFGEFGNNLDDLSERRNLNETMGLPDKLLRNYLVSMEKQGLIEPNNNSVPKLTSKGRKRIIVVMAGGSFDIIHPGHIETLKQAKALGDVLIVSVARNVTYEKSKHKAPIHDEKQRCNLVSSIKYVEAAVLGSETDIFETVRFLQPDIIALGYDQVHTEEATKAGAEREGIRVKVVRLRSGVPDMKTSKIVTPDKKDDLLGET